MGCGASAAYSQISPEQGLSSNEALCCAEAPEVEVADALAWQASVLTKPALAREATTAHSPKEALALDLFLLSANLVVSKDVPLLPTQNIFNEVLVGYSIKDSKELKAGAVAGHGETYLEQRRDLVASLYREVKFREGEGLGHVGASHGSKSMGMGSGPNDGAARISPPTKPHSNITRGFLATVSNLFGGHVPDHGNGACRDTLPLHVFSPQEGANLLQAGQVLIDLFHGYHPLRSSDDDYVQKPLAASACEWADRDRNDLSSRSSSPSGKYGSPSAKGGSSPYSPSSPSAKSQHSKVAAFALSSERMMLISDIYLGQLRAILLQYFQSLTSPALSQKQATAQSPMSLALSALRQTDTLLVFIYSIAVSGNGGFGILLMSSTSRNLWIQCIGHVCGTMNLLCNLYMHHFLNTGSEHKYNNNKYTLLSLLANSLPLMLSLLQDLAPCVTMCDEARLNSSVPNEDLVAATAVLQRAYWKGCECMLELAHTVKVAVGVLGTGCGAPVASGRAGPGTASDTSAQPSKAGKSTQVAVLSAGQQMLDSLQLLLGKTSPIRSPHSLFDMMASLVDAASTYLLDLAAESSKALGASGAEEDAILARNEKVMLDSLRTYGVHVSVAAGDMHATDVPDTRQLAFVRTPSKQRSSAEVKNGAAVRLRVDHVTSAVTALNLMLRAGRAGATQDEIGCVLLQLLDSSALSILKPGTCDERLLKALLELAPAFAELFCATGEHESKQKTSGTLSRKVAFELSKRLTGFVDLIRTVLRQRSMYTAAVNGNNYLSASSDNQLYSNHNFNNNNYGNHANNSKSISTKTQYTANSSDKILVPDTPPEAVFSVGDKVDGLCKLANDSERWFAAVISATTLIPSPDGGDSMKRVYTLNYEDGDIHVNKSAVDIRKTKKRAARRTVGIPATIADTGFTARALEATAVQERGNEKENGKLPNRGESVVVVPYIEIASHNSDKENQYRNNILSVEDGPVPLQKKATSNHGNSALGSSVVVKTSLAPLVKPTVPTVSHAAISTDLSAPVTLSNLDPVQNRISPSSDLPDVNQPQHSARDGSDAGSDNDNDDNGFFIIPSVFDGDDDLVLQQRTSSKQLVPKMEFDMSVLLSQSIQSVTSLSSLLTADRESATGRHSINGSNTNTYRSTHLDSFRYPRDRAESMTALDSYGYHPTGPPHASLRSVQSSGALSSMTGGANDRANSLGIGIGMHSLASAANSPPRSGNAASTFLSRQNMAQVQGQGHMTEGVHVHSPPRAIQFPVVEDTADERSAKERQYGSLDVLPGTKELYHRSEIVSPEYLLEPLDEHTLLALVRTYALVAASLLPRCVQDGRLHGDYTCIANESNQANTYDAGQGINVAYSIRELFEILNVVSITDEGDTNANDKSAAFAASETTPATKLMRTAFETAMLRSTNPGSGARRLLQLCGLSLSTEPVMSVPCLTNHLSGNDSNISNVSLGKGGFADVSLVICPVDCPCNSNASRLGKYCSLMGIDLSASGVLGGRNQALLDVAKQRLSTRYAVKRLRRERSPAEEPPLIHNIFNEITCLEILRDANTVGVCKLFGFGVTEVEYVLPLEVGGKNLSDWRNELSSEILFEAVCDVLRRGKFNKNMPVGWPVSMCIHNNSVVVSSQLLPFATATVDDAASSEEAKATGSTTASAIPDPTAAELDTIMSLLLLEIYWDISLIVKNVHERDIAHYDLKCGNIMFRHDLVVEEEAHMAQEQRQRQLIQAEEEELVRIAQQSAEAAVLATKLKKQWEYSPLLEVRRAEVAAHCAAETERRSKGNEQIAMLKSKMANGKNPKVKAAYAADIKALELRIKTERAERKEQEESLVVMQAEYESLKGDADACEMRHSEANVHRQSARSATRSALEMDNSEAADEVSQAREVRQQQRRLLVSLLRSMPYMRACHLKGEASGMLLLFDFGESVPYVSAGVPKHVSAHERRCRGTLPIQAPEFLSITSGVSGIVSTTAPLKALNSSPQTPATSSRVPTPAGAASNQATGKRIPVRFAEPSLAADIWSLGCLLPELVTGSFLFANMPWTEMYVSLCTIPAANAAGVTAYDIDGEVDTSSAAEPNIDLFPVLNVLSGGEGALFSDKYALAPNQQRPPVCASANLNAAVTAVETVMRQALRRLPSNRPNAAGICKMIGAAMKEVAFSKGDIKGYQNVLLPEQQRAVELPKVAPCATLNTPPGTLLVGAQCSFSLSARPLSDFAGLVDPSPPQGLSSVAHVSSWLGRDSLQAAIDKSMHIVCFTTRPHYDPAVRAAVGLVHDITVSSGSKNTDSRGHHPGFETDMDPELLANYVHTTFPVHALHDHTVVELDASNSQVMRQWSDLHEEWLHRFDVWEEADQACLDDPKGTIIDCGGRIVGVFIGGHLAATVAMKPKGSVINNRWELVKLAVHPTHSRQGLGKLLLNWVIDSLCASIRKHGGVRGTLYLESNKKLTAAMSLYKANGFKVTHERDLVAEAAQRAAKAIADAERITLAQPAAKSSWGGSAKVKLDAPVAEVAAPSVSAFPSPYETCDIILEKTLDVLNYKPLLSTNTGSGQHTNSSASNLLSPRVTQSYSENTSGGSLRFVHVDASEPGALEDVALAIRSIAKTAKDHAMKHNLDKFTLLVDPIRDKPSSAPATGVAGAEDIFSKREYDVLSVAGAAVLLESLGSRTEAASVTTVGAAHAIIGSIRPHSHPLESAIGMLQSLIKD